MAGIEYINEDLSNHPICAHGPTLLFSRRVNDKGERRNFFACSACRDRKNRKHCSFFLWESEKDEVSDYKKKEWEKERKRLIPHIDHRKQFFQLNEIQNLNETKRSYCSTCSTLIIPKFQNNHSDHDVKSGISNKELARPSTFLTPLSNEKKEAQFLFSESAVTTIIDILQSLKLSNILCIGAPRIHENIQAECTNMSSLLLDLDHRYHNFHGPLQFCWYNLFNHHFFLPSSKTIFEDFLQTDSGEGLAIVMDPPFGGRVEPISQTLNLIEQKYQSLNKTTRKLPVFLFYPYFMEPHIKNSFPDYHMVDYKVDYENHPLFQNGEKGSKFGSPVRMFTNLSPSEIVLPESEGYRFCSKCKRWVYEENKHCKICKACTSKDGRTYEHCNECNRCVKPTWKHCKKCDKCAQPDHTCGDILFTQACFHCKERGHKKNECPKVDHEELKHKRMTKAGKDKSNKKMKK